MPRSIVRARRGHSKDQVLREAARVLTPGGRFAVADVIADPDMDDATRADMQQLRQVGGNHVAGLAVLVAVLALLVPAPSVARRSDLLVGAPFLFTALGIGPRALLARADAARDRTRVGAWISAPPPADGLSRVPHALKTPSRSLNV